MINIQNIDDNECFESCLARYLHTADHNPTKTRNVDKDFARKFDFKDIKFSVKIRDFHKTEKKNSINISALGYENQQSYSIYVSRNIFRRYVDLLLIEEESKMRYVLIKGFSTFMYDHTLNRGRKHFRYYYLQAFSPKEKVKYRINGCFKTNPKQRIKMTKNGEYVKFKNHER